MEDQQQEDDLMQDQQIDYQEQQYQQQQQQQQQVQEQTKPISPKEISQIFQTVSKKYIENCETIRHNPNKALLRVLNESGQNGNLKQGYIDIIFRGNDKFNFTQHLKDKDVIILCECFKDYGEYIRHVDFSYNDITDSGAEAIATMLSHCQAIESLNLSGNSIETVGGQALSEVLKENFSLRYLNLNSNKIKTDGAMNVIEILFNNKNLVELNLADNDINHDGIIGITSVLNWNNNTLLVLNVDKPDYTSIGQETAIHFAKMLQSNRSIEKLSLQKHGFTCDAIYTITEHLLENNRLRVLDLTANKISFKGCEALAKYLCGEYCVLESLILASNRTGHYGAKMIAQALSKSRTLLHLDMTRNDIDDNGLKMIAESLETNDMLISLKLYWNHFGQMALQEFHKLRKRPKKGDWFWDFHTYIVDNHIEMAYIETTVPYDVQVSTSNYYLKQIQQNQQQNN